MPETCFICKKKIDEGKAVLLNYNGKTVYVHDYHVGVIQEYEAQNGHPLSSKI